MQTYLIIPISAIVGAMGALFMSRFGSSFGFLDICNIRSSHRVNTPRAGGIGIYLVFLIAGSFWFKNIPIVVLIAIAGFLGLVEDRFSLSSKIRLLAQFILSLFIVLNFFGYPSSVQQIGLFLFCLIFITGTANFYNFMDGINGIAGLTGVVCFMLLAIFSYYFIHDISTTFLSFAVSSACLGFLLFNFPTAKVFMGDVGSILLGFISASVIVKLSSNINIFLCLIMFLCMFYADAIVTIYYRWKRKENLMCAHRSHLYQYMTNELGVLHWKVSLGYALIQFFSGLVAMWAYSKNILFQLLLVLVFGVLYIVAYKKIKLIPSRIA